MQPVAPYRYTHVLGGSPVGRAWAAVDTQGRFVSIAVLEAAVANDPRWREAFAATANALARTPGGQAYVHADFTAAAPWVAYPVEAGPGPEKLFRALGVDYQPASADADPTAPVSGVPRPSSGVPHQVSGPPVSAPPQPVSGAPQPVSGLPVPPGAGQPVPDQPVHDPFTAPVRRIQPSVQPRRRTGLWLAVVAAVLVVAVGSGVAIWALAGDEPAGPAATPQLGGTSPAFPTSEPVNPGLKPWAKAAPYSPEERALAVAAPSLVFIEAVFSGVVREAKTNVPLSATPVTFKRRCSGFVVNPDGQVVTNGQCVRPTPESARERALYTLGRILVEQGELPVAGLDQYVRGKMSTTVFTGGQPGSEPTSEVFGQLNVARGDLTASPAVPGQVVRVLPADAGNLALVKLAQADLPAVELNAGATPAPGASLLVIGYHTTDADFRAATYTLDSKPVQVAGTASQGGVAVARVNDDVGIYSHGGIGVDTEGRVVGVLDNDRAANGGANRALVPAPVVGGLLDEAGVGNGLSDADRAYRDGLAAFFAGRNDEAIARFDAVAQASPTNLVAQAYRRNAVDRSRLEADSAESSSLPTILLAGLVGALVAGLGVAAVLLARRRSRY